MKQHIGEKFKKRLAGGGGGGGGGGGSVVPCNVTVQVWDLTLSGTQSIKMHTNKKIKEFNLTITSHRSKAILILRINESLSCMPTLSINTYIFVLFCLNYRYIALIRCTDS